MIYCPNCGKFLKYNYAKKRRECPKYILTKNGARNYGCGWVNKQSTLGEDLELWN